MAIQSLLIANRGEIAIRIARAAADLGLRSVAIYSEDDAAAGHLGHASADIALAGSGAKAYLDIPGIIDAAVQSGCDAVHPGYGFLAESAPFAQACADAGLTFVGPSVPALGLFGDKVAARALAERCDVPLLPGTNSATSLAEAGEFYRQLTGGASMMIKAIAGGGGRGIRVVNSAEELESAYAACVREAELGFGNGAVYVEEYLPFARHLEVQVLGDGLHWVHLHERECSVQRRQQKLVEIAPSPTLPEATRQALYAAALSMAKAGSYSSLGTFEFLVDANNPERFAFMEANARLQVEHTVTEEVTGVDLVQAQLQVAAGASLTDLGLTQGQVPSPRGYAIQLRVNMETLTAAGEAKPAGGTLNLFDAPLGPGLRVDTYGYAGYTTNPNFDSLLAKLVVSNASSDYQACVQRAYRALCAFRVQGVATNLELLRTLVQLPEFASNEIHTTFVQDNLERLLQPQGSHAELVPGQKRAASGSFDAGSTAAPVNNDPLAVLDHGKGGAAGGIGAPTTLALVDETLPDGVVVVSAPMQGTVVNFEVEPGDPVFVGQPVLVMEAMKMEHVVTAQVSGHVQRLGVAPGDAVFEGHSLIYLAQAEVATQELASAAQVDLDYIRPDLQEVIDRHAAGLDVSRPEAVAKRRKTGHRTARENVADLCDEGTFIEYGSLVLAGQRRRRSIDDLVKNTTGDGMVCGLGQVNGAQFPPDKARCLIMSYDYMVLAGTQGMKNHAKKDRMFEMAEEYRLPTVLFAEGGGGRPGDTDGSGVAGLDCWAFTYFARLSALVPIVGITTGRCFAGNAVLLACCDVIIATEDSNIGIGGPAMIEGGGLGVFRPEEVGPMDVQVPNGVVDIEVKDEAEAVLKAKQYLSYFQGPTQQWEAADQRQLRSVVPENRLRFYDIREVIQTMADVGSVLELRAGWGHGIVTAFARIEGKPVGIVANNPGHLSGAIDADGADKGTRFMQLCDAFDIPVLFLCDCPGIMVGPEIERSAVVRHAGRMFVTGANISVPFFTIIIRKAYGLGAQAMAGGSFKAPLFVVSWPTGEFGGMGLEGAVKLGYRKELAAIEDPDERKAKYDEMVAGMYERGKAVNVASHFELDDVIDPADSRHWIARALNSVPLTPAREGKKRPNVDTW